MAALARKGAVQEGCLVPLLGLRPQNGTDGRGVAPAGSLGSGVTTILEDYPLGPLDRRRKGLRWTKQKLMTCHTQLSSVLRRSQSGALEQSHAHVFYDVFPFNKGQAEILAHLPTALFNF